MVVSPERLLILQKARSVWSDKCMKIRELKEHIPKRPVGRPRIRPDKLDLVDKFITENADKFVFDDEDITDNNEDITEHTEDNEDNGNNEDNEEIEEIEEIVEKVPKKKRIIRKIIKYVEEDDDDNDDELIQYTNNYNQNQYQMPPNVYNEIIPKQMIYNEVPVNNTNKINFFNY